MPSDQAPAQFPEPPPPGRDWAVFLDVDGCLLEIAARPDEVVVASDLVPALAQLRERLNGAVALVSGRSLAHLDALFSPLHLAAAGQHGLERRDATGRLLPLVHLDEQLHGTARRSHDDVVNIVVLQAGGCRFGLVVDNISSAEVVTADGRLVRASGRENGRAWGGVGRARGRADGGRPR